jgi:hypothetical protein
VGREAAMNFGILNVYKKCFQMLFSLTGMTGNSFVTVGYNHFHSDGLILDVFCNDTMGCGGS